MYWAMPSYLTTHRHLGDHDSVKYWSTNSKLGFFTQVYETSISSPQACFNADVHGFHTHQGKLRRWASSTLLQQQTEISADTWGLLGDQPTGTQQSLQFGCWKELETVPASGKHWEGGSNSWDRLVCQRCFGGPVKALMDRKCCYVLHTELGQSWHHQS